MLKTSFEQIVDVSRIGKRSRKSLHDILTLAEQEEKYPAANDDKKVLFLGIDLQNDFMEGGGLGVPGSLKDVENITKFIYHNLHKITRIAVSLDSHLPKQIFHPCWWQGEDGRHPEPYTIISAEDVKSGKWKPIYLEDDSIDYVINLEKAGKKQLCIWPYHCIDGTDGHALESQFSQMIYFHSVVRETDVMRIVKGLDPATEMYGIFRPEYSKTDAVNEKLLAEIKNYDRIIIAGEAKSHCVLESTLQLAEYFAAENEPADKIVLLEDGMSIIPGFEEETEKAFRALTEQYGIRLVSSRDLNL